MTEETNNRHATDEREQLIEKELAHQWTEMFTQFSEILMRVIANSGESSMRYHFDKINPFKVQMNLDIPNLEGKIDVKSIENWVQQLESYYSINQLSKEENITIASLKMSTFVHCWWENLSTNMEKEGDHKDSWEKLVEYVWKEFDPPKYIE